MNKKRWFSNILAGVGTVAGAGAVAFIPYYWSEMNREISQLWESREHINNIFNWIVEFSIAGPFAAWFNDKRSPVDEQPAPLQAAVQETVQASAAPQPDRYEKPLAPVIELVEQPPPVVRPRPEPLIDMERLYAELKQDEGIRHVTYRDSRGFMTAGIGHLLRPDEPEYDLPEGSKVSDDRVINWFRDDVNEAITNVAVLFPEFKQFPMDVRLVLVNMVFQLGYNGLSRFQKTIYHIRMRNWAAAADEMLNSKWAKQTPKRARRHANRIRAFAEPDVELV